MCVDDAQIEEFSSTPYFAYSIINYIEIDNVLHHFSGDEETGSKQFTVSITAVVEAEVLLVDDALTQPLDLLNSCYVRLTGGKYLTKPLQCLGFVQRTNIPGAEFQIVFPFAVVQRILIVRSLYVRPYPRLPFCFPGKMGTPSRLPTLRWRRGLYLPARLDAYTGIDSDPLATLAVQKNVARLLPLGGVVGIFLENRVRQYFVENKSIIHKK